MAALGLIVVDGAGQGKGLGKNKSSRLAGLFSHLLRHEKSYIALLCASFRSSNMTENPAQYGTTYSCRGPYSRWISQKSSSPEFMRSIALIGECVKT
jgi:hypothetical protein